MTNRNTTKRSLVSSALAMLMCVAMLIGTTFAWFTDTATSGVNRIVAGNLDVDMLYKSGTMTDYATVNGVTNNGDGTTPIFVNKDGGKILWEPGAMVYTYFDVENLGTLAFQYNFALRITGMNALETAGVKHNLSEVVKAVVLNGEVAGDLIKGEVEGKTWNSIESFEDKGSMLPEDNKKFTVVLYWEPTNSDNLYNVNNGQQTTAVGTWTNEDNNALYIDFDIQLTATQVPYESDSFDKFYDNIDLGLIPASWNGESQEIEYNNGGRYEVVVDSETKAAVEVPAGAKTEDGDALNATDKLKVVVDAGTDAAITVETGNSATTYDVSLVRVSDGKKVVSDTPMKVDLDVGFIDLVRFYHNGLEYINRKTSSAEVTEVGDFFYDVTTGFVTFMTKSFSPFSPVYKYAGGLGTAEHPYLIANADQFVNIKGQNRNYQLTQDINLTGVTTATNNTYGFDAAVNQLYQSVLDGANHTVTYYNGTDSVFGDCYHSTLKNITFDLGDNGCPISGYLGYSQFDNVAVNGTMQFTNNTGVMGYYCYGSDFTGCTINVDVTSTSYSGVFMGYNFGGTFNITDCTYTGKYVGPYAGIIFGNATYYTATVNINNLRNNGVIRHTLINESAANPFTAINNDGQWSLKTLTVNRQAVSNDQANNFQLDGTGSYVIGPEDTGLNVTINDDETFNITKSSYSDVSYYEIEIISNVANVGPYGGSGNIAVMETITDNGSASYNTTLKNFKFADGNEATYQLGDKWGIITLDGKDYYLNPSMEQDLRAGTGNYGTWMIIRAYNAQEKLVSSNLKDL